MENTRRLTVDVSPAVYIRTEYCRIIGMHNQAFFYRSTVTGLVHSISHKHRNPALIYSKMFVVARSGPVMFPSRVSCISTCSPRYLNSNVATRATGRKIPVYAAS